MKFDINKLSSKLHKIDKDLKDIERNEVIKKYGTFLDSKQEVLQLYLLFMFFGVNVPQFFYTYAISLARNILFKLKLCSELFSQVTSATLCKNRVFCMDFYS